MQARRYQEKMWNKKKLCLVQYRVTTVKTITVRWLFILQPIKAIQLFKHLMHVILLEGARLRHIFFCITCRLGTFSFFWRYVCMQKKIFFFPYSTYIWIFNFRQIFDGKSYPRLIYGSTYTRKYTVPYYFIENWQNSLFFAAKCRNINFPHRWYFFECTFFSYMHYIILPKISKIYH